MSHDDFAFEPIRGLPEELPDGERLLWQGGPNWRGLAKRAFHVRGLALYFGVLLVWQAVAALIDGKVFAEAVVATAWLAALAVVAVGTLALLSWLYGRSTVYTITDKRIVMRTGIAIPVSVNIPYAIVEAAALKVFSDGRADLPLHIKDEQRISYLVFWPNVRPWRLSRPEPMLRAVDDGKQVAQILTRAMRIQARQQTSGPVPNDFAQPAASRPPKSASNSRPLFTAVR